MSSWSYSPSTVCMHYLLPVLKTNSSGRRATRHPSDYPGVNNMTNHMHRVTFVNFTCKYVAENGSGAVNTEAVLCTVLPLQIQYTRLTDVCAWLCTSSVFTAPLPFSATYLQVKFTGKIRRRLTSRGFYMCYRRIDTMWLLQHETSQRRC